MYDHHHDMRLFLHQSLINLTNDAQYMISAPSLYIFSFGLEINGDRGAKYNKAENYNEELHITRGEIGCNFAFLNHRRSFESLMFQFKIHKSTSSQFIPRVCEAIYNNLKDKYLKLPQTTLEWINCESEISQRWQFPNCIGAADGKHISIFHPKDSGSDYYNYKGFFSVVLLALVDYDYKFTFVDVGCQGRITDGGVFRNSAKHSITGP